MKILDLLESEADIMNSKEYKSLIRQERSLIKKYKATKNDIKRTMLSKQIDEISSKRATMLGESVDLFDYEEDCDELKALMKKGMTRKEASEFLRGKASKIGDGNGPYRDGKGPHGARRRPFRKGNVKPRLRQRFLNRTNN